ncbi:hypothetical protein [Streptomyces sp. NPDC054829]
MTLPHAPYPAPGMAHDGPCRDPPTAGIVAPLLSEGDHSHAFVALVIMAISAGSIRT